LSQELAAPILIETSDRGSNQSKVRPGSKEREFQTKQISNFNFDAAETKRLRDNQLHLAQVLSAQQQGTRPSKSKFRLKRSDSNHYLYTVGQTGNYVHGEISQNRPISSLGQSLSNQKSQLS